MAKAEYEINEIKEINQNSQPFLPVWTARGLSGNNPDAFHIFTEESFMLRATLRNDGKYWERRHLACLSSRAG
jgi:hypothetical protein